MKMKLLIDEAVESKQLREKLESFTEITRYAEVVGKIIGVAGVTDSVNPKKVIVYQRYFDIQTNRIENRYCYFKFFNEKWNFVPRPPHLSDKDEIVFDKIKEQIK